MKRMDSIGEACPVIFGSGDDEDETPLIQYRTSHGLPTSCSYYAPRYAHRDDENNDDAEEDDEVTLTPREAVLAAQELNRKLGHENNGFLSFSHGFAPRISPITSFPPEFDAWNTLCEKLPFLVSSKKLRAYCDEKLPLLDAKALPPMFALRAASVMGYVSHAYWNMEEHPEDGRKLKLPRSLHEPWAVVSQHHLNRTAPLFLGFFEHMVGNFKFEEGKIPPPPEGAEACAWITEKHTEYGSVEYNPIKANVSNFELSFSMTKLPVERNFYGVLAEAQLIAAPAVRLVVEIQEAASKQPDIKKLKILLEELLDCLTALTFDSFNTIQQQRLAPGYVDATLFAKIVAPIPVPITKTLFGPSGTASPLITLLDILFGRNKYGGFIGKEIKHLSGSFPRNWSTFLRAVKDNTNIPQFVESSGDAELQGLLGACLQQWAGENGFLGRHKLKMVGYIEVSMKLGRPNTIGGFQGLLKSRGWDKIADHLKVGQDERFQIPLKAGGLNNVGMIIETSKQKLESRTAKVAHQVRIDIKGSGIRYAPGSHVGILYESNHNEVYKTLLAFADGNATKASILGNTMVHLNTGWITALQQRRKYHHTTSPTDPDLPRQLDLKTFLGYGELRPASRRMLELAYQASFSNDLQKILDGDLQAALSFSDVVTILRMDGVDLLANEGPEGNKKSRGASLRRQSSTDQIKVNLNKIQGSGRRTLSKEDREALFVGVGLTPDEAQKVYIGSLSTELLLDKVKSVMKKVPKLCEIIEPAKFRHYSIASSNLVHPDELHLYCHHLKYDTKSAVAKTSPLLADTEELVRRRGAASDYIVSKSLPRYHLAIEAIAEQAGLKRTDDYAIKGKDVKFHLNSNRRDLLKHLGYLSDEEIDSIVKRAKGYDGGGEIMFRNLTKAIKEEMRDKPDTGDARCKEVVLKVFPSPRFRLPRSPAPCIMIAAGTGLAPFRSFWQHLAVSPPPANGEKHLLIIGMRSRENMMFENEILLMVKAGVIDVEIMFSRDECKPTFSENEIVYEDFPGRSGYIDKVILDNQERMTRIIREHGAYMYVCGNGAVARTAIEALDSCLCNEFGELEGKDELERMVAQNRMVFDIFTSLIQPKTKKPLDLSELCQFNDFAGVRKVDNDKEQRLLMVINASVYDMKNLFRLHPGGDTMLKLYCGMDATKAWDAVKHSNAPEVVAMLEMFDTGESLRQGGDINLNYSDKDWYKNGWRAMTMTVVEIQNCMSLSYEKNWDGGHFSSEEEHLGHHYTVWEGEAAWRPKRSLIKGDFFVSTHDRIWSKFLPVLLGYDFDELRSGLVSSGSSGPNYINTARFNPALFMDHLRDKEEHRICDSIRPLLKEALEEASAIEDNMIVPPTLQAYMEEVRIAHDGILESIKARLITGLQVFEAQKSPLLPAFYSTFDGVIVGIIYDLDEYIFNLSSLTVTQFGEEKVKNIASMPGLKRGCLTLINAEDLESNPRHFVEECETINDVPKCSMHHGA